jgi:transcription elongation factor GreA
MDKIPLTPQGHELLTEQLHRLKHVEKPQNIRDIETAREHGDLSENAEYHAAKERQGIIAGQIQHVEDMLARAEVIDPRKLGGNKVVFGATVDVYDVDEDEDLTYQIVGPPEADSKKGLISVFSPIARAMIGREVGDEVVVKTPGGERILEVVEIKFI